MSVPPVLLYHAVCPVPQPALDRERPLFVHQERFADQMDDLARRGYRALTLGEFSAGLDEREFPHKAMLLTFDDAYGHVDDVVTPVLRRYGFTAVMFAPFGHLGGRNTWDAAWSSQLAKLEIATAGQLRALSSDVWEVASHGLHHIDLRTVPPGQRRVDLITARERLTELVGRPALEFAYPYGAHDVSVRRDVAFAGYRMAFAARNEPITDRFRLSRTPISGEDSLEMFRLKTSGWTSPLYRAYDRAPRWVRGPTSALLRRTGVAFGTR
jgi:peptidoglycan/xylan/chitin deacetylase (PgdA/CDA1 family)